MQRRGELKRSSSFEKLSEPTLDAKKDIKKTTDLGKDDITEITKPYLQNERLTKEFMTRLNDVLKGKWQDSKDQLAAKKSIEKDRTGKTHEITLDEISGRKLNSAVSAYEEAMRWVGRYNDAENKKQRQQVWDGFIEHLEKDFKPKEQRYADRVAEGIKDAAKELGQEASKKSNSDVKQDQSETSASKHTNDDSTTNPNAPLMKKKLSRRKKIGDVVNDNKEHEVIEVKEPRERNMKKDIYVYPVEGEGKKSKYTYTANDSKIDNIDIIDSVEGGSVEGGSGGGDSGGNKISLQDLKNQPGKIIDYYDARYRANKNLFREEMGVGTDPDKIKKRARKQTLAEVMDFLAGDAQKSKSTFDELENAKSTLTTYIADKLSSKQHGELKKMTDMLQQKQNREIAQLAKEQATPWYGRFTPGTWHTSQIVFLGALVIGSAMLNQHAARKDGWW